MNDAIFIPGAGIIVGQAPLAAATPADRLAEARARRAAAVAAAEGWLLDRGDDPWEVAELDLGRRTRHAWWVDGAGFVPADYPGAQPVLMVDVPVPEESPAPHVPKEIPAP